MHTKIVHIVAKISTWAQVEIAFCSNIWISMQRVLSKWPMLYHFRTRNFRYNKVNLKVKTLKNNNPP